MKKPRSLAVRNVQSKPPTKKQRFEYYCMVYEARKAYEEMLNKREDSNNIEEELRVPFSFNARSE